MNRTTSRLLKAAVLLGGVAALALFVSALSLHACGRYALSRVGGEFQERLGSLDPRQHELPALRDDDNAAFWLERGASGLDWTDEVTELIGRTGRGVPLAAWSAEDRDALAACLAENAASLEVIHAAAGIQQSTLGVDLMAADGPPLAGILVMVRVARLLKAEARLALAEGDGPLTVSLKGVAEFWNKVVRNVDGEIAHTWTIR